MNYLIDPDVSYCSSYCSQLHVCNYHINRILWQLLRNPAKYSISDSKMASTRKSDIEPALCIVCFTPTKYSCIGCPNIICARCSCFESDEETEGWIAGKSVGYYRNCYEERVDVDPPDYRDITSAFHFHFISFTYFGRVAL